MVKKLVPVIALLAVLGGVYKFVLAKPAAAEPKPHVEGTVYMLQKEFLINLADGRFAKMQIGLVLAHDDTSTAAAGGHEAAAPPVVRGAGFGSTRALLEDGIVAAAVVNDFAMTGVLSARMSLQGFGNQIPVASNSTAEGRAKNRRVEIVLSRIHTGNTDTESTQ